MHAKALALPFEVTLEAVVIQARLADGDDFRMVRQVDQLLHGRLRGVLVVGMHTDRGEDMGILLGQREHLRKVRQVDRHAQGMRDLVLGHLGQHLGHAGGQFRKIDVAVGIDKHPAIVREAPGRSTGATVAVKPRACPE